MLYRLFGKSGLRVSEVALGTMTFGPEWGWGAEKDESKLERVHIFLVKNRL
jgi:aryl-alcohol dehydrogenase-like predicted oxidoreductase